jgi:hypothetical protein
MSNREPSALSLSEIEQVEKFTLRCMFQAVLDFGMEACEIVSKSPDEVKDVAEDVTREILDRLPGFNVRQRIFGTVDYKKARYIILPDQITKQALLMDSKAEKKNSTATIQMSQTSMTIRQHRSSTEVDQKGLLPEISEYSGEEYLTTTALIHYKYRDRRLNGNNIRGGKYQTQTRVFAVGELIEKYAQSAGFYMYDRRIWLKDAAWENSRWHTISYRAVDEIEYVYVFWKPGITRIDRSRLTKDEWTNWGSRAVWSIRSVRSNSDHDSKFPVELPRRVIKLLTEPEDVVLDCFIGSGTTALAALSEGKKFVGVEKEKRSVEISREAVSSFKAAQSERLQMELVLNAIEEKYSA